MFEAVYGDLSVFFDNLVVASLTTDTAQILCYESFTHISADKNKCCSQINAAN